MIRPRAAAIRGSDAPDDGETIRPEPTSDRVSSYLDDIENVVRSISRAQVRVVVDVLFQAWRERRTTYIIGNGGSASTASHMMNDLSKMTSFDGMPRFRAIALADNVPYITAIANDMAYGDVFVEQLRNLLLPQDVLIAISGSGNSKNIVRASLYAREVGAIVVGLCGKPGSLLCECADAAITIPAEIVCQQEDGHLILNHTIALALRDRIGGSQ